MTEIADRLAAVRARIEAAAACSPTGRSVRLVAVGKGHPASALRAAFDAGQRDFGENYAQELGAKARELADLPVTWHFIGHLQRNKVRDVAPLAAMVHTVDRVELAAELSKRATASIEVLLEVNVAREARKSGCALDDVEALARSVASLDRVVLRGLMAIPPAAEDPEESRAHFRALAGVGARLVATGLVRGPLELSMGMSHDFEVAIEEGATIVRVGTDIFGPRPAKGG